MNLEKNTEFILNKVDSIFNTAMPYIEKGGEEFVRYHVIKFSMEYLAFIIAIIIFSVVIVKVTKFLYTKDPETSDILDHQVGFPIALLNSIGWSVIIAMVIAIIIDFPKLILCFMAPEMFTIMEMLGK